MVEGLLVPLVYLLKYECVYVELIEDDEEESATTTLMAMLFVDCCFQYHPCIVSLYCILLYFILIYFILVPTDTLARLLIVLLLLLLLLLLLFTSSISKSQSNPISFPISRRKACVDFGKG